jgi:hypothetical protein
MKYVQDHMDIISPKGVHIMDFMEKHITGLLKNIAYNK